MRPEPNMRPEAFRSTHPKLGGSPMCVNWGYFEWGPLRIISSGTPDGNNPLVTDEWWEHVSVSCINRCPTWEEMQAVKELFWSDDETVVQIHPPRKHYVNHHPYCLHLWRNVKSPDFPLPPKELIG